MVPPRLVIPHQPVSGILEETTMQRTLIPIIAGCVAVALAFAAPRPASATTVPAAVQLEETSAGVVQQVRYYRGRGYRNYGYRNYGYRNYGYRNYGYGYRRYGYGGYGYRPYGYYGGYGYPYRRSGISLWFGF
jgi:hypothetical protein